MPIIAEDGTGRADAVTYQTTASVLQYLSARGVGAAWSALSTTEQEAACVLATDYLQNGRRFHWRGARMTPGQALAWPRTDALDDDGVALPPLPARLLAAHAELCYLLALRRSTTGITPSALQPVQVRGNRITTQSVSGISQTFADDAPSEDQIESVLGLLAPLLTTGLTLPRPHLTINTDDLSAFDRVM